MEMHLEITERSYVQVVNTEMVCPKGFPKLPLATFEIKSLIKKHLFHVADFPSCNMFVISFN